MRHHYQLCQRPSQAGSSVKHKPCHTGQDCTLSQDPKGSLSALLYPDSETHMKRSTHFWREILICQKRTLFFRPCISPPKCIQLPQLQRVQQFKPSRGGFVKLSPIHIPTQTAERSSRWVCLIWARAQCLYFYKCQFQHRPLQNGWTPKEHVLSIKSALRACN